jgi:hypothetical protein
LFPQQANNQASVPAFMTEKEANKKLPVTLPPSKFTDARTVRAYEAAKEIPKVLAQQPCYCWCSRGGHRGLLDCYVGEHAAECGVCQKEALFALKMTKEGKTPAEIRDMIERNQWVNAE